MKWETLSLTDPALRHWSPVSHMKHWISQIPALQMIKWARLTSRYVWDMLGLIAGGWPCLSQKSSQSLPYRWPRPKYPSSHPQLIWSLDWGPGQLSAWSERISISVKNLCPRKKWTGDSDWESEKNWDCSESPVHFSPGHLNTFSTELEILSDQAESWPGPQSSLHMSWGCELPWE